MNNFEKKILFYLINSSLKTFVQNILMTYKARNIKFSLSRNTVVSQC